MPDPQALDLRELIWAREQAIYAARGQGDLALYANEITGSYLAWPPQSAQPLDAAAFADSVARFTGLGAEELSMTLTDFTADGDSALIYYSTHRTRLPDGRPVDEHFEVIHVWLRRADAWRLFGGMARHRPDRAVYSRGD